MIIKTHALVIRKNAIVVMNESPADAGLCIFNKGQ